MISGGALGRQCRSAHEKTATRQARHPFHQPRLGSSPWPRRTSASGQIEKEAAVRRPPVGQSNRRMHANRHAPYLSNAAPRCLARCGQFVVCACPLALQMCVGGEEFDEVQLRALARRLSGPRSEGTRPPKSGNRFDGLACPRETFHTGGCIMGQERRIDLARVSQSFA